MNTIAMMLLCAGLGTSSPGPGNAVRLPAAGPWGYSAVFVRNDTVTVITNGSAIYLFKIVGDSIVSNARLAIGGVSESGELKFMSGPSSIACLYKGTKYLNLYELAANDNGGTFSTKIPALNTSEYYLIPQNSSFLIVYEDYDKPFTLNSHNLTMEYGPLAYRRFNNGVISEPTPIESGRIFSSWFQSVVVNDTVYAVWEQGKHESFMTWITDVKRNLVFARYDGTSWSKPKPIYDATGRNVQVHGIYELNNELYCLWSEHAPEGTHESIFYIKLNDRERWSSPVELSSCAGFLNRWLACSDGRGRLHLVISDSKKEYPVYYTFDGKTFEYRYDLKLGDVRMGEVSIHSLSSDNGQTYLFYSKCESTREKGANPSMISGTYVSPEGDTYGTELANPNYRKEEPAKAELFMLVL